MLGFLDFFEEPYSLFPLQSKAQENSAIQALREKKKKDKTTVSFLRVLLEFLS